MLSFVRRKNGRLSYIPFFTLEPLFVFFIPSLSQCAKKIHLLFLQCEDDKFKILRLSELPSSPPWPLLSAFAFSVDISSPIVFGNLIFFAPKTRNRHKMLPLKPLTFFFIAPVSLYLEWQRTCARRHNSIVGKVVLSLLNSICPLRWFSGKFASSPSKIHAFAKEIVIFSRKILPFVRPRQGALGSRHGLLSHIPVTLKKLFVP